MVKSKTAKFLPDMVLENPGWVSDPRTKMLGEISKKKRNEILKTIIGHFAQLMGYWENRDKDVPLDFKKLPLNAQHFITHLVLSVQFGMFFERPVQEQSKGALAKAFQIKDFSDVSGLDAKQQGFVIALYDIRSPDGNTVTGSKNKEMTYWPFPVHITFPTKK